MKQTDILVGGQDGYHTYRIPSIITTLEGTALALCEGRKFTWEDKDPTDILLKRSTDNGETWSETRMLVEGVPHAMMDPSSVVDRDTGTIWLMYERYPQGYKMGTTGLGLDGVTNWVTHSTDDGKTWSEPVNITATTKQAEWQQMGRGPGRGIQTGTGRLIIPTNCRDAEGRNWVLATYSDDHGKTWRIGGRTGPDVNECQVVELSDGSLMINMRSYREKGCRAVAISRDDGDTWSALEDVPALVEPVCQASIVRYGLPNGDAGGPLLFSNPASPSDRANMTVKLSHDEGGTWPTAGLINSGPSAYSCLTVFRDGTIGCLYERGRASPYERITLARFTMEWLTNQST